MINEIKLSKKQKELLEVFTKDLSSKTELNSITDSILKEFNKINGYFTPLNINFSYQFTHQESLVFFIHIDVYDLYYEIFYTDSNQEYQSAINFIDYEQWFIVLNIYKNKEQHKSVDNIMFNFIHDDLIKYIDTYFLVEIISTIQDQDPDLSIVKMSLALEVGLFANKALYMKFIRTLTKRFNALNLPYYSNVNLKLLEGELDEWTTILSQRFNHFIDSSDFLNEWKDEIYYKI